MALPGDGMGGVELGVSGNGVVSHSPAHACLRH